MSYIWPAVTKDAPCPICGKPDWCCVGDFAVKCMRVPSSRPTKDGGWYHKLGDSLILNRHWTPVTKRKPTPSINAEAVHKNWRADTTLTQLNSLAATLGVSVDALLALGAVYAKPRMAWAFPMFDGDGNMIGLRLRNSSGDKWAETGSRQGIFLPQVERGECKYAIITEGPTDAAAALTLGFYTLGRPSCNGGAEYVNKALRRLGFYRVVIACDDDTKPRRDGTTWSPGIDGARALAQSLKMSHIIWPPGGAKDLRDFVRAGGTREMVESSLRSMIWKR